MNFVFFVSLDDRSKVKVGRRKERLVDDATAAGVGTGGRRPAAVPADSSSRGVGRRRGSGGDG